jgi:hypothetical protein
MGVTHIVEQNTKHKKREEMEKLNQRHSLRRPRRLQMFHYKYYREQQPLNLLREQMDRVVNAVIEPQHENERVLATKIFIKV